MKTVIRVIFISIIAGVIANHAMLIGFAIGATRYYIEDRVAGLTHSEAMCIETEFVENILYNAGFDLIEAREIQRDLYQYWC